MNPRRAITLAILAGLAAAGVGIFATARTWQEETVVRPYPLPDEIVTVAGTAVVPWALPAGMVGLAGVIALVATTGVPRRIVTVLLAGAGAVMAASGAFGLAQTPGLWPVVTAACGTAVVIVAAWGWSRYRDWPHMSARYDRPAESATVVTIDDVDNPDPAMLWDALDRGEDPTREPHRQDS
ncbi:putative membrane protein (TIGR02234 family) [Stackebrandtia endophytica]|uniref:Putative membrane protein (TIGR02234 family) n=1 Tax=Stackebrandtia endophytica TaxID=1496996 RepID=A0A543AQJ3_9ACTN|nr:Trp biosynthesis-associated membrane protein [Stackebrandtia endophytica]TQL74829.1 putative membrane protein (TIGR02234 family) [Stackebrandtia endophytica]